MKKMLITLGLLSLALIYGSLTRVDALHAGFIEQQPITSTINNPLGLFIGDIDNDTYSDVVSTSSLNKTISWYRNNGDNTFSVTADIATLTSSVSSITGADLDNDGFLDIIATSYDGNRVSWYLNNGDKTFSPQTVISYGAHGAISVAAADLNNDGLIDIISGNQLGNSITWYKNNGNNVNTGNISFSEQSPISTTAGNVNKIQTIDFDLDGYVDIVSTDTSNNTIRVYKNNAGGTFELITSVTTAIGTSSFEVADIDNDTYPDIVTANAGNDSLAWYKNNNGTSLSLTNVIASVLNISNLSVGDFNDDGDVDIISISSNDNNIALYENNGLGIFEVDTVISSTISDLNEMKVADLDQNGSLDLVVTSNLSGSIGYFSNQELYDFAISFVDYDGAIIESSTHDFGSDLSTFIFPENPEREGYTFTGWSTVLPENMTYYDLIFDAEYSINQYTLAFVDYDGTVLSSSINDFGSDLSSIVSPIIADREGAVFGSWDIPIPPFMPSSDVVIKALFITDMYTIEFYDYNGVLIDSVEYAYLSELTDVITPEVSGRTGYEFIGWDIEMPELMPLGDISLTAVYEPLLYLVEYQDYDGTVLQSQSFPYLSDLTVVNQPEDPEREGYTFVGWDSPLPSLMGINNVFLVALYVDSEAPVISGLSNIGVNQSEASQFQPPVGTVVDNADEILELEIKYFNAEGEEITNFNSVISEIGSANNIVIKYNATDSSGNKADEVSIHVYVHDDIAPIITGISNNEVFARKSKVTIDFNEGTATLNERSFSSGSTISISNTYRLVVTDNSGNTTVVNFEIQDYTSKLVVGVTIALIITMVSGLVYIRVKGIF